MASRLLVRSAVSNSRAFTTPAAAVWQVQCERRCHHESHLGSKQAERLDTAEAANMMDIGTRKIFNEDHDMFREAVRKFCREEIAPQHEKWEQDGKVSREIWQRAGDVGMLGVNIRADHGGHGADYLSSCIVSEEMMYANTSGPGFPLVNEIVMPYISNYGSKEQVEKYIPALTAGTKIGAIAMTEPSAGSDLQGIRTNARQDGSDWIINGSKVFITNGYMSDVVIVVAVTNKEAKTPAHGISLFIVDEGMPGFKKGKILKKMGAKAQDTAEMFFDDVRVPASAMLGDLNTGFYKLMAELPQERLLIASLSQASAEFMFEETRKYVKERKAFRKTLAHLQTIQHKLAELKTEICVSRAYLDDLLQKHSHSGVTTQQASMAKLWASEMVNRVAYACVQMHGGWGYMWEYPVTRAYVDARLQPIYGGANEIMKELIARHIVVDK